MRYKVSLLVGDIALTIATLVTISVLYPQELGSAAKSVPALVMFVLTFTGNLYVFELYDFSAGNGVKTIYRLVLAYVVSAVFLSMWFSVFPWFGEHRKAFTLAGPALLVSIYAWRRVYAHAVHLFATSERILVIGSQSDAETVSRTPNFSQSKYDLVGFLLKEEVLTPGENGWMANGESTQNPGEAERPWAVASGGFGAGAAIAPALAKPKAEEEAIAESPDVVSLGFATAKRLEGYVAEYGVRSLVGRR